MSSNFTELDGTGTRPDQTRGEIILRQRYNNAKQEYHAAQAVLADAEQTDPTNIEKLALFRARVSTAKVALDQAQKNLDEIMNEESPNPTPTNE